MPDDTTVSCAKLAELIEMSFGLWTLVGPRKYVLRAGAEWRHLLNSIAPSMCGSDAAFCQVTLTACYYVMWSELNKRSAGLNSGQIPLAYRSSGVAV